MRLWRVGLFVLAHTLHTVDGKGKASSLNLADATLLVIDGLAEEGMDIARQYLGNEDANVNVEVEHDDGSKGTPLAVAIHSMALPKAEDCMELITALISHKNVDVNAPLTAKDGSTVPPLVLATKVVAAGIPAGMSIATALLAHNDIKVNAMTGGEGAKLGAIHMAFALAARGRSDGQALATTLVSRDDVDVDLELEAFDGTKETPLAKLASMLQDKSTTEVDPPVKKALGLLHGKAKRLADDERQRLVDDLMKDEL